MEKLKAVLECPPSIQRFRTTAVTASSPPPPPWYSTTPFSGRTTALSLWEAAPREMGIDQHGLSPPASPDSTSPHSPRSLLQQPTGENGFVCKSLPRRTPQQQLQGFQHFLWLFTALGYGSDFLLRAVIRMPLQEIEWPLSTDTLSRRLLGTGLVCPILAMWLANLSEWERH